MPVVGTLEFTGVTVELPKNQEEGILADTTTIPWTGCQVWPCGQTKDNLVFCYIAINESR